MSDSRSARPKRAKTAGRVKSPAAARRPIGSSLSGAGPDVDDRVQRILATVDSIPAGAVATYGQVAEEAGLPGRARLVGRILGSLPAGSQIPWHRVINAAGRISERPGDCVPEQRRRLRAEGVRIRQNGRIDLAALRWTP